VGRILVAACTTIAACGFSSSLAPDASGGGSADAPMPPDAKVFLDAKVYNDAPPPKGPACGGKVWLADFSSDPTLIDLNEDGTNDFAMRTGGPLQGTLSSGFWIAPAGTSPLDTQPKQDFATITVIDVTMRNDVAAPSGHNTVMWLDADYTTTTLAPIFIDLQRDSATQHTLTVYDKPNGVETSLFSTSALDGGFHHIHLIVDPSVPQLPVYNLSIDGVDFVVAQAFSTMTRGTNDDRWATLSAGGDSEFDSFQVEVCP
jgi:hypothetical protein